MRSKRFLLWSLLFLILTLCFASAQDNIFLNETMDLLNGIDTSTWQQQVPQLDVQALLERFASGDFTVDSGMLMELIKASVLQEAAYCLPALIRVMVISLILSILVALRGAFNSDDTARLCELIAFLAAAIPLGLDFMGLVDKGEAAISNMSAIAQSVLPTMIALLASIGAGVSAAAMEPIVLTAGSFIAGFLQNVVLHILRLLAVMVIVNSITDEGRFTRLIKLMKTVINWSLGTCFTVFLGLLAVKGLTGGVFDSVALRAAKYTVDNLVPVVGGLFKDSVETLAGCSLIVKNAVGLTGLLSLLAALLAPGISILVVVTGYKLCAAVMEPMGQSKILIALDDFASVLTTLFVTLLTVAAIFFVFVTVLMMIGTTF